MVTPQQPLVLVILDGWGYEKENLGNPIQQARTPAFDMMIKNYPMTLLQASGLGAGMSWGEVGNSEVGHITLGAGRIVKQYRARIQKSMDDGSFYTNTAFVQAFEHAKRNNTGVHIAGLLTSGTVHADYGHLVALLEIGAQYPNVPIYIHLFLDGKDSGLHEAPLGIEKLANEMTKHGSAMLATVIGRDAAMDRDGDWNKTKQAYDLLTSGSGKRTDDMVTSIKQAYDAGATDMNMPALSNINYTGMHDNDACIFFNFREDSMRQIFQPYDDSNFNTFEVTPLPNLFVATMTRYIESQNAPYAYSPPVIAHNLPHVLSNAGKKQLHIAETQKYAHVTYFFNGLVSQPFEGEDDVLIDSPKSSELEPQLRAVELAQRVEQEIRKHVYDFIVLNIANADVLAHSSNFEKTVTAIEAADKALEILYNSIIQIGGTMIITADHGNAEGMIYKATGQPESKHNQSPVHCILIRKDLARQKDAQQAYHEVKDVSGVLADVAPTILTLMGIEVPIEMNGNNLLPVLNVTQ